MATIEETLQRIINSISNLEKRVDGIYLANRGHCVRGLTLTVGTSKNFSTLQSAIDMMATLDVVDCVIQLDPGTYTENVSITRLNTNKVTDLIIKGDTRRFVGMTLVSGATGNIFGITGMGSGTMTLSNVTTTIVAIGSVTNPDFTAAGLVVGDRVMIRDSAGTGNDLTVASVGTNSFTVNAAPANAVTGNGCYIIFKPNVIVQNSGNPNITFLIESGNLSLIGIEIINKSGASDYYAAIETFRSRLCMSNCVIRVENVAAGKLQRGVQIYDGELYFANPAIGYLGSISGPVSLINYSASKGSSCGILVGNSRVYTNGVFIANFSTGYYMGNASNSQSSYSEFVDCTNGFDLERSIIDITSSGIISATNGVLGNYKSFVVGLDTSARFISVTNAYPAATGAEFNSDSMCVFT